MQLPTFQTTPDASVRGAEPRGRVQCLGGEFADRRLGDPALPQYIRGRLSRLDIRELVQQEEAG
jgi:hypothetical protein